MTQIKNPSENIFNENQNEQQKNNQDIRTEKENSQEVDLPIPEKKNDVITTGINGEKPEENTGQTGQKPEVKNEDTEMKPAKDEKRKTGFDPENSTEPARKDKRGDESQRLERDDTTDPKTKDAKWQQDKMNEANNQQAVNQEGSKNSVDKAAELKDKREDSILDRPKTETYEKAQGENVGG
ncbi:MAG: hypothetical protein HOP31_14985, partial [Ignavibacteria bacterium]|nr:hypothetical protein [Ignavibacteria bacterium]